MSMKHLDTRLSALETATTEMSAAVKQWLGMELTERDRATVDGAAGIDEDFDGNADYGHLSPQTLEWLGL